MIEGNKRARSKVESSDIVHEMGIVGACSNRGERIEDDGSVAFGEKEDGSAEAAMFEMMKGVAGVLKRTERVAADETNPGDADGDEETEFGLSA